MRRQLMTIATLFYMISLAGCAPTKVVLHDRGSADPANIALLRTEGNIYVFKVNGDRPKGWTQNCTGTRSTSVTRSTWVDDTCGSTVNAIYELPPGDHTFTVYWAPVHLTVTKFTRVVDLKFSVYKGKTYLLKCDGNFLSKIGSDIFLQLKRKKQNFKLVRLRLELFMFLIQPMDGFVK